MRNYPREFTREARARVETAILRAGMYLDEKRDAASSSYGISSEFESLFYCYVLTGFLAFANECCALVIDGAMDIGDLDATCVEFLNSFSYTARLENGKDSRGHQIAAMHSRLSGLLEDRAYYTFRNSEHWKKYEKLKLHAAECVVKATAKFPEFAGEAGSEIESQEQRGQRRKAALAPHMKRIGKSSPEALAGGLDKNTVRDFLNGKTCKLRDSTREALAKEFKISLNELPD